MLRMLNAQMQRQVHLPENQRPRVPLLVDEAHYVSASRTWSTRSPPTALAARARLRGAVLRAARLRLPARGENPQGRAEPAAEPLPVPHGRRQDAEEASRIAMAVYATMIRDDPDSRARLRVTPEQALNFPNHYCLASWISNGTRDPAFMGETYPLPSDGECGPTIISRPKPSASRPTRKRSMPRSTRHHRERRRPPTGVSRPSGAAGNNRARVPARALRREGRRETTRGGMGPRRRALVHPRRQRCGTIRTLASTGPEPRTETARRPRRERTSPRPGQRDRHAPPRPHKGAAPQPSPAEPAARRQPPKREVHVDYEPPPPPAQARRQPRSPRGRAPGTRRSARDPRGARARQPPRARVP